MKILLATTMVFGVMLTLGTIQPVDATVIQPVVSANVQSHITPARHYYYDNGPYYQGYGYDYGPGYGYGYRDHAIQIGPIGIF